MGLIEFAFISRCIVSICCFGCAAYVASTGNDGWGWLIFAGILSIPSISN